jgi:colanic acid/amylovoran biosynthesis glycosyltransferase
LRVAHLVSYFPILSETFILDQITGLIDRGCEVEIYVDEPAPRGIMHPEIDTYGLTAMAHLRPMPRSVFQRPWRALGWAAANAQRLGRPHLRSLNITRYGLRAASLRLFFETAMCAERKPFDVIHCHFGPNGLRGMALREIGALQGKLITSFYGYDVSEFLKQRQRNPYKRLFAEGDLTIAISDAMRRQLIHLGSDDRRIVVHRLGVNPALFVPVERSASGGVTRILTIGRMVQKKGIEYGLRAVAAVAGENAIHYEIIGDGPLRREIERCTAELGLGGVVRLAGWRPRSEVVDAMRNADVLLAPSLTSATGDQEGTPVVILEALASGLPVVSTVHAGIPEVVEDEVSGILVPERDVAGLALALKRLIGNAALRAAMGRQGRSRVQERHDIRKLNDGLMEIYRNVATGTTR